MSSFCKPYRQDSFSSGGGLLVYIKEDIATRFLTEYKPPEIVECLFVEINIRKKKYIQSPWRHGVVVITIAQLHSTKSELRFCAGANHIHGVSDIRDGEDLWQWSRLGIRLNAYGRSIIPQKQFIFITIIS